MKLLGSTRSAFHRYLFGRNVARRLARAKHADLLARVDAVNTALLTAWTGAVDTLGRESRARGLARSRLAAAEQEQERTLQSVSGALIARVGKAEAERFFRKAGGRRRDPSEDEVPTDPFPRPTPVGAQGEDIPEALLVD